MLAKLKIENIVYFVADIDRTEAFYRDVLGLDVQRTPDDENGDFLMMPTAGGISLIFFKNADIKPGQTPTVVYTLEEGGIDAVVAGLAKKGRNHRHAHQPRARRVVCRSRRP